MTSTILHINLSHLRKNKKTREFPHGYHEFRVEKFVCNALLQRVTVNGKLV